MTYRSAAGWPFNNMDAMLLAAVVRGVQSHDQGHRGDTVVAGRERARDREPRRLRQRGRFGDRERATGAGHGRVAAAAGARRAAAARPPRCRRRPPRCRQRPPCLRSAPAALPPTPAAPPVADPPAPSGVPAAPAEPGAPPAATPPEPAVAATPALPPAGPPAPPTSPPPTPAAAPATPPPAPPRPLDALPPPHAATVSDPTQKSMPIRRRTSTTQPTPIRERVCEGRRSLRTLRVVAPAGFEPATSRLEGERSSARASGPVSAGGVEPLVGRLSSGCTAVVLRARSRGTDSNHRDAGSEPARLRRRTPEWKWRGRESNPLRAVCKTVLRFDGLPE